MRTHSKGPLPVMYVTDLRHLLIHGVRQIEGATEISELCLTLLSPPSPVMS